MRLFLSEKGIPYEINLGETSIGMVWSPQECKRFYKLIKGCAKDNRPYFLTTVPDGGGDADTRLKSFMAFLMEKVGLKRPPEINLDSMKAEHYHSIQEHKDDEDKNKPV